MLTNENDKRLIELLFKITNSKRFTQNIISRLETDEEKKELIYFLENNTNLSRDDINFKALEIVAPRWGINV